MKINKEQSNQIKSDAGSSGLVTQETEGFQHII